MFKKLLTIAILSCTILNVNAAFSARVVWGSIATAAVLGIGAAHATLPAAATVSKECLLVSPVVQAPDCNRFVVPGAIAVSVLGVLYYLYFQPPFTYSIEFTINALDGTSILKRRSNVNFDLGPLQALSTEYKEGYITVCKIKDGKNHTMINNQLINLVDKSSVLNLVNSCFE